MQDTDPRPAGVSMAQLLAAFDGLGAHACILDQHGKVRWVNEPWRRFASENDLAPASCCEGTDYLGACGPARNPDDERVNSGLRQVIAGESAQFTCDYPCHSASEPRWFQLVARTFRSDDGTRGTIVVHSDITARVLAEQERSAMQRNLLQLQRMESLGTSARGIAHDFNNVLTAMVGNLELAQMHTLPTAPVHELLAEMTHAVDRARSLVVHLYDLAQARAPRPEPVPLRALADEVASLVRGSLPSTQKVVVDGDPGLAVRADRAQLRQLLLNLCNNAADALAGRAGTMAISLRRERPAPLPGGNEHEVDDFACIEVRDDGRGLTPDDCKRLFEPFHAPTYARQSSGLGLSVALAIAKSHGGTIAVTSEPGDGSSFRVFLPLASAAPIEVPRSKPASRGAAVLVVDPDQATASVAVRSLQREGHRVMACGTAAEAVALLTGRRVPCDVVTVGRLQPNSTCPPLVRSLAAQLPELCFLVTAAADDKGARQLAAELPQVRLLAQPARADALAAAVTTAWTSRGLAQQKGG